MRVPLPRLLLLLNVAMLIILALAGVDWYVRWRVGQGVNAYHVGVIMPMVTPRPPATPPK